jgi:hypothetical protein
MPHAASRATVSAPSPCTRVAAELRFVAEPFHQLQEHGWRDLAGLGVELVLVRHSAGSTFTRPSATDTFTTICPV